MNDGHRAAGRGGSGAVIGSKKLKAVVVKGTQKTAVYDRNAIVETNKAVADYMNGPVAGMTEIFGPLGTGVTFTGSVMSGDSGVKNFSGTGIFDYPEDVATSVGSVGLEPFNIKKYRCSGCPLGCGAILSIPDDRWDLLTSPRPEYETMASFGSMLLNTDPAAVCHCNDLCNEYGVDTISTGDTIAWAMECYNDGLLSRNTLDGIDLTWGNSEAIVEICQKICESDGIGAVLAKGSREASRILGTGADRLVTCSGIEEPMHDIRLAWGAARTYQYDPTPGRHVKGGLGLTPTLEGFDYSNTGEADKAGVINTEIMNAAGYCLIGSILSLPEHILQEICAVTGFSYTQEEASNLGLRSFTYRHAFNLREGFARKDFTVSDRVIRSAPDMKGPLAGVSVDNEKLADNFFDTMHWDKTTLIPSRESLEDIGSCEVLIHDLYEK